MGKLMDFLGGFGGSLGNQLQEKRRMDYATAAEELQRKRMREDAATTYNLKTELEPPVPTPYGQPVQRGPGNWVQPTRIARPGRLAASGTAVESPGAWEDGPDVPAQDPNALTPYQQAQISQKELDREAKIQAAKERRGSDGSGAPRGEDGLTAYQREQLKLQREREARLTDQGTRGNGGKKDTPDAVRKTWTETAAQISTADTQTLRSIAAQYGMDQRGLPSDDAALKDALLAQVDAEFGKRLESSAGKARAPDSKDKTSPAPAKVLQSARDAIAKGADPAAVRKRVAEMLGIDEKDVQL